MNKIFPDNVEKKKKPLKLWRKTHMHTILPECTVGAREVS